MIWATLERSCIARMTPEDSQNNTFASGLIGPKVEKPATFIREVECSQE